MRFGVKADLLHCLDSNPSEHNHAPVTDVIVIDGAAVVQMLNPGTSKTFQEYSDTVFSPYISTLLKNTARIDLVWDVYLSNSLKGTTRLKRGKGTRRGVASSALIPKNWKDFLLVDENKAELFGFISRKSTRGPLENDEELYATCGTDVLCVP